MSASIEDALAQYNRVALMRMPTPLDHLQHLSAKLGPEIYLKRDDLTELTLGGDKARKLEYELVKARDQDATILVTCGSCQSNHARLTTAAARKLGMQCAVICSRDQYQDFQGNLLTVYLMGAQVHVVETQDHWALENHAISMCESLEADGQRPYYIPVSGSTPLSCLGYVRGGLELVNQIEERGIQLDAIYTPFGTGGTFSALLFAMRERGITCPVIGISVNRDLEHCRMNLDHWWTSLCEMLGRVPTCPCDPFEIHDSFIGKEYGDPTEASLDAVMLMAQSEGILLDPVYSGKTFSGLCAHHAAGRWKRGHRILMLHSGGVPALFAYHEEINAHLVKRGITLNLGS